MSVSQGTRLGPYEIQSLIGVGGMGEVYRGRDTRLNRIVAIKIVSSNLASDPRFRERFELEAHTISQLNHPNICTLYDVGREDDKPFLVMEYVKGETLAARLADGPLPVDEALDLGQQMAQALAHAHRLGIIHRDIKPANVIITESGTVKILDFGLAKSNEPSTATQTGIAVGTLAYMAPEQLLTGGVIGPATDVWALGVVLFEMLTGARPFRGREAIDVFKSILNDSPQLLDRLRAGVPKAIARVVATCLEKSSERRFPSAVELVAALNDTRQLSIPRGRIAGPARINWWAAAVIVLLVAMVGALGARSLLQQRREQWARQEVLPEIERLLNQDQYAAAFTLARQVQPVLGSDPVLSRVMPLISVPASFQTEPPGAVVSFKPYADLDAPWEPLGVTPLDKVRLPRGAFRFKFEKEGHATTYVARALTGELEPEPIVLAADAEMVNIPGGALPVNLSGFNSDDLVALGSFAIDRTEVTNRAYKAFVDANGYATATYWRREASGREFVDSTGHPGPATWEVGGYPSGRDEEPVGGVSWYEADAYCAFRGKQLPTVFHWARAALSPREITAPLGPSIVPLSNFSGEGPAPVGSYQGLGPYGTSDIAGNVREWNWNGASSGRRWILGGAWNDPNYMFSVPSSQPADDRSPENGFRCMRQSEPLSDALLAPIDLSASDYRGARPVSDEIFRIFAAQFAYVGSAAPATAEPIEKTPAGTRRERVEIRAGYDNERLMVYLFMPDGAKPPYQAVLYFPALSAFQAKTPSMTFYPAEYIPRSGRVLVMPVYKGSFERWDSALALTGEEYLRAARLRLLQWRQDVGRTLDYLAGRGDIDMNRLAYYGRSFGASMPLPLLALEPRFKVAILHSGGFTYRRMPAEMDAVNYVSRLHMPTLMLNGRHDYVMPLETSQKPLFDLLGTRAADKRHVVFDAGHDPLPRNQIVREMLAWLDRYFGVAAPSR